MSLKMLDRADEVTKTHPKDIVTRWIVEDDVWGETPDLPAKRRSTAGSGYRRSIDGKTAPVIRDLQTPTPVLMILTSVGILSRAS
jgi:hypothetical protein